MCLNAFSSSLNLDDESWNDASKEYVFEDQVFDEEKKEPNHTISEQREDVGPPLVIGPIVKWLLIIGVVVVVIYFLIQMLAGAKFDQKVKPVKWTIQSEDLEEYIDEVAVDELVQLYQSALENNEFKLAMRLNYLILLRSMIDQQILVWNKHKTNGDFVRETRQFEWGKVFSDSIFLFESVWYSEIPAGEAVYSTHKRLIDQIKTSAKLV